MSHSRRVWGLGLDHLWPLIILAGLGFYTLLVPLPPNDFWWHLKIGELISTTRAIPTTNMFAWTLPADFTFTGLWDFAWWVHRDVNFSPRITQITLIFYFFFA